MTNGRPIGGGVHLTVLEPFRRLRRFSFHPPQESIMKKPGPMPLIAVTLMISATYCFAQNNNPPANTLEHPANTPQQSIGTGTAPENIGATGWTGGSRGQTKDSATTTGQSNSARDTEAAKDQPSMATGQDLKGPPARFPANKTPE
jgi:hypothetical protein